jgi:hypothetical protein
MVHVSSLPVRIGGIRKNPSINYFCGINELRYQSWLLLFVKRYFTGLKNDSKSIIWITKANKRYKELQI